MATKTEAAPAEGEVPKKGKKKLIIIVLAVLLLAGGGGGAWWFLGRKNDAERAEVKAPVKKKTEFLSMEPWFTVNLQDEESERYLQTGLVFEFSNPKTGERMKEAMPVIRSKLLFLLSGKSSKDVNFPEGKELLADEIIEVVKEAMNDEASADGLEAVHFSVFVIQ